MGRTIWSQSILTQYGLVSIRDFDTEDEPEVEEFLPGHVYVATRTDTDGKVAIDVAIGEPKETDMRTVIEEVMTFESGILCITAPTIPDEETVRLPRPGQWAVKICVRGEPRPDWVGIYFSEREWREAGGI